MWVGGKVWRAPASDILVEVVLGRRLVTFGQLAGGGQVGPVGGLRAESGLLDRTHHFSVGRLAGNRRRVFRGRLLGVVGVGVVAMVDRRGSVAGGVGAAHLVVAR